MNQHRRFLEKESIHQAGPGLAILGERGKEQCRNRIACCCAMGWKRLLLRRTSSGVHSQSLLDRKGYRRCKCLQAAKHKAGQSYYRSRVGSRRPNKLRRRYPKEDFAAAVSRSRQSMQFPSGTMQISLHPTAWLSRKPSDSGRSKESSKFCFVPMKEGTSRTIAGGQELPMRASFIHAGGEGVVIGRDHRDAAVPCGQPRDCVRETVPRAGFR